jgi:hypothetical protein
MVINMKRNIEYEIPKEDYKIIRDKNVDGYFRWFLIMSLFWRYE